MFSRAAALLAALLVVVWLGPAALLLGGLLAVPRVRDWLRPADARRTAAAVAVGSLVATALVIVAPDGWLPVPQGPGRLVTPAYVGRPAIVRPVADGVLPPHPHLAEAASGHPGPIGDQPSVDTGWYGRERCRGLAVDARGRLVGWCGEPDAPVLRVVDPESLNPLASRELGPGVAGLTEERAALCDASFLLDERDRAVVGTGRSLVVVDTADGDGEPDLTVAATHDLSSVLEAGDCVAGVVPDWSGRLWFASVAGVVGLVEPASGRVRVTDLGEAIANGLVADEQGGVYAVTEGAAYKLLPDASGDPVVLWRTQYDAGSEQKPGQLARGSGTTPAVLPNGTVALVDNAEPQPHVVFLSRTSGEPVCSAAVFDEDGGAVEGSLAVVADDAVVVANHHGSAGWAGSGLGFTPQAGLARVEVDVSAGECRVRWTNEDVVAPGTIPAVSLPKGLVYIATKRPSAWGVSAWYLTTVDVHTGRHVFSVRTGTGPAMDHRRSGVTLAPSGAAYVAAATGLVRVADKVRA
ncbi:hypothetical protein ACFP3Q_08635 [Nocardioides sp. GCM10027113]|uniref:hypothetical protein n=1 Tax=unclassified Nocardioides TaxID=2615069 RepID=UPI00361FF00D